MIKLSHEAVPESEIPNDVQELERHLISLGETGKQTVERAAEMQMDKRIEILRRVLRNLLEDRNQRGTYRQTDDHPLKDLDVQRDWIAQIEKMDTGRVLRLAEIRGIKTEGKELAAVRQELLQLL